MMHVQEETGSQDHHKSYGGHNKLARGRGYSSSLDKAVAHPEVITLEPCWH